MAVDEAGVSEDAVLGGRLVLRQPLKGHRVGHDAILLAAACSARGGDHLADLGAGVGAAGLAVARRLDNLRVTLVEIDPALAALARDNAVRNGMADRAAALTLDVTAPAAALAAQGLLPDSVDHVLMNPPFNAPFNPSPDPGRRLAHAGTDDTLTRWTAVAARLLRPEGVITMIWRADGLSAVLSVLAAQTFGAIAVLPIHPKPAAPAIRVIMRGVKASAAAVSVLPGLVLAEESGKPTAEAEAVLRHGGVLALARGRLDP